MKKKKQSRQPSFLMILGILFSVTIVLTYTYYFTVDKPYLEKRLELHQEIIMGTAASPYQYRILIPVFGEILFEASHLVVPIQDAFALVYVILDMAGIFLLVTTLYLFLSLWFDWRLALIGTLFCTSVMTVTYQEHYFQPWSFWEAGFFNLALILIYQQKKIWLGGLVAVASLNRETALLIPLVFFLTTQEIETWVKGKWKFDKKQLAWFAGYVILWALMYYLLHILRPSTGHIESLREILRNNLVPGNILQAGINLILFMGIFWLLAAKGSRRAPQFLRRAALIIPLYIPLIVIWAYWREVRVLMFIYPIITALGLFALPGSDPFTNPDLTQEHGSGI